jgi:PAS domain S-box-containing protein
VPSDVGLTPRRRRVLLTTLLVTILISVLGRLFQDSISEHVYNVVSSIAVATACATVVALVAFIAGRGWLTWLVVLAGLCLVVAQVISITEDIAAFDTVPVLGTDGAYHHVVFRLFDFAGLALWIVGFFGVVFELNRVRNQLWERSSALEKEVQRNQAVAVALAESEDRYRHMVEDASDIIFQSDLKGYFTYANKKAAEVTGYAIDELVGLYFLDLIDPIARDEILQKSVRQFEDRVESMYMEFPMRRRDDRVVWIGQNLSLRYSGDKLVGAQAVARDITERKSTEWALKRSEERYRLLVEATGVIPWEADAATFEFSYIGPQVESILGYPQENWYQTGFWASVVHSEDRDEAIEFCRSQTELKRDHEFDYRTITADGSTRWMRDFVSVVEKDGSATVLRGIFVDITEIKEAEDERRRLQEQMQHAQKLESLGVLAGGIAHDFNNLLAGIMGNAELALQHPDEGKECLGTVITTSKRAGELCQRLLAYSGRGKIVVQPHDLSGIVREMGDMLALPVSNQARLDYEIASDLPSIEGDATQIRQVILNIVTNAAESIEHPPGVISVTTGVMSVDESVTEDPALYGELELRPHIYFEVTDTGCGMDRHMQERMFDPFYSTKFSGRGLGLAAVLGIMRSHSGGIRVKSEVGEGTSIRLLFPASAKPVPLSVGSTKSNGDWRGEGTVLVVDDESVIREYVTVVLRRKGFEVVTAEDGAQAVLEFRKHVNELVAVVLDLTMPNMDGAEAHREMLQIREGLPVIVISGFSETEATNSFTDTSLAGFIQKPFQAEELLEALKHSIAT